MNSQLSIPELKKIANGIRIDIIEMLTEAGSGHPGSSLSLVELLTALYFRVLRHDPKNPLWPERDRFVLSKGHGVPTQYCCLAHSGYFPRAQLMTLRKLGSPLQGHPDRVRLPGIEASTGSLGQGLSIAQGMAMGQKLDGMEALTYCVIGDGEMQEGQIWEAAMSAPMHKLSNLVVILDWNKAQIDGFVREVMNIEPIADKWEAFGWNVLKINGHSFEEIFSAYDHAKQNAKTGTRPTFILADTIKGKGVSFMEGKVEWHGVTPNKEQAAKALAELRGKQ